MNILVTGGAGYIGSVLVPWLLSAGHNVHVVDNFSHGVPSLSLCCFSAHSGHKYGTFSIDRFDVRDTTRIHQLMGWPNVVIPLAAVVGAPACDVSHDVTWDVNFSAVGRMIDSLSKEQRVIIPITNSGYGIGGTSLCTEESPLNPVSVYGQTKIAVEKLVMERENSISLRLATVFGMSPRMRMDLLVNDFVWQAVTRRSITLFEASFRRNFIHVGDVCTAFLHAVENFDTMRGQVYNVGLSDTNIDKAELCERIKKHVPNLYYCEAPIGEDPDKRDYVVSNTKIEATGWKPHFSLDDGIQHLITGYQQFSQWGGYGNV